MTKDIGGYDAVGIVLYETSGTTPTLLGSYGEIHDGNGINVRLNNPSVSNTSKGIGFEYQDYITVIDTNFFGTKYDYKYMAYGFMAVMRFDSNFTNFSGKARGFYTHTWDETTINSLGFNGGVDSFGLNVSWSDNENHFLCFSNADTDF